MNSYLLRRLFPFYILAVAAELVVTVYSMAAADSPLDMSFFGIVKTFGILLLTTTSAFLVMMIPYVAYLMLLPRNWQNGRLDKYVSYFFYLVFAASTLGEELLSAYFWQSQELPASLAAFRHSYNNPGVLVANLLASPWLVWVCLAFFATLVVLMYYTARFTLTAIPAPKWLNRVFQTAVYAAVCVMTYLNINAETLMVSTNDFNNELSEEGTYMVIKETVADYAGGDFSED